jgi:metal-dependent amidase/aminoacylase/carboxypeptidase family protein
MTETQACVEEIKSLDNKIPVLSLNKILMDNAELVNAPRRRPPREKTGSTDFGNVMYRIPGSCIRVAFVPEGSSSHSEEYIKAGKSEEAHEAIILGAKILAASAFDIISSPKTLAEIRNEFERNRNRRDSTEFFS